MDIKAEKIKLVHYIMSLNSASAISNFKKFIRKQEQDDLWEELPDEIKADVEESIRQLENGEGIPHEKVMKRYEKWLKK
ncbi:MAG: hypothetical protein ACOZCO_02215 [Bacteroidota bacterium]